MIVRGGSRYEAASAHGQKEEEKRVITHFSTKLGTGLNKLRGIGHKTEFLEAVKVL
jgi:hypothetical protein